MKMWRNGILTMLIAASFFISEAQQAGGGTKPAGDTAFVRKNIQDNMSEIQMAELAIDKNVQQKLKNVAITIRDDHKQMLNEMLTYAQESNMAGVLESTMNISTDTLGQGSASSGNAGILNRNRRDDAESVDESRNKATKKKATQEADQGKPSGDRRGTGYDHSRAQQADGGTGAAASAGINHPSAEEAAAKHQEHMGKLQGAEGDEFRRLWVDQMITMHEAKLKELQSAQQSLSDSVLKQQVTKAIPKIRNHLKLLQQWQK